MSPRASSRVIEITGPMAAWSSPRLLPQVARGALALAALVAGCGRPPAAPLPVIVELAPGGIAKVPARSTPSPVPQTGEQDVQGQATQARPAPATSAFLHVQLTTLQLGESSGVTEQTARLITDAATWRAHWQQHTRNILTPPPAPAIDFGKESVLAVYLGEMTSGGYSVTVTRARWASRRLIATVTVRQPTTGDVVTLALTQAYHLVRLPAVPAGTALEVEGVLLEGTRTRPLVWGL